MTVIEQITAQEFEEKTSSKIEEVNILVGLNDGEAIKFPCKWGPHESNWKCPGTTPIKMAAKKLGVSVKAKCRAGTMYALRVGPESGEQHDR